MRIVLVIALICTVTRDVAAEPRPIAAAAKPDLDRGLELFKAHDYAGAIAAFDDGYGIDPHPDFLYAKAQAQRLGGDCRGAMVTYARFLATHPDESQAELARTNISRCASSSDTDVPPAQPTIADAPRPPPPPPPGWYTDHAGLLLAGLSVATIAVATGYAFETDSNAASSGTAASLADWRNDKAAWEQDRVITGIAAGVAGVLAVAAGVRFYLASRDHSIVVTTGGTSASALIVTGQWR